MAAKDSKSMDVSKPGKSAPDNSSRPVLVTHRPMVQDPMVTKTAEAEEPETPAPKKEVVSHSTKTLQPTDTSLRREEAEDTVSDEEKEKAEQAAVVDAVAGQMDSKDKKNAGDPISNELVNQEKIEKLITEQTYFVPVGQVARRRQNRHANIALIVLVLGALIGGYLAVDAGVIGADIALPIDLIKN